MTDLLARVSSALAGRYRVLHSIGTGGMAVVYQAEDLKHGRPVAIKILKPELASPSWSSRFLREIRIASGLQHPAILPLYDSGEAEGLLFYVMPLVHGESLRARLRREGTLPVSEAVRLGREVAEALDYAHERGVVHRDIKPENILLSGYPPRGPGSASPVSSGRVHALVCDFGIARALRLATAETPTEPGLAVGTPAYMSPEQFAGGSDVDTRSDIYSLGCVLFEVLAGVAPFQGPSGVSFMMQHSSGQPPALRRYRGDVPAAIEDAVARAMAKLPGERFATAAELGSALELPAGAPGPTGSRRSGIAVAVLPFANLSADPNSEYLSDGITEELMQALARVQGLRVIGRTSVFALKGRREDARDLGQRLRADVVVDGGVRIQGGQVRISAQLVDTADGFQVWAAGYQRPADNTFAIEDAIAAAIADALRSYVSGGEPLPAPQPESAATLPRRDPVAHEAYLKGRYHWNKRTEEGIARSVAWFERAVARAPDDSVCLAALADAHLTQALYGWASARSTMPVARVAADRALAVDPRSARAHTALGSVRALFDWAWPSAEDHFRRALQLEPDYATSHQWQAMHLLTPLARFDEARRALEHARELEPLSPAVLTSLAVLSFFQRDWDLALRALQEVLEMEPGFAAARYFLGQSHLWRGETDAAERELSQAVTLAGRSAETVAALAYAQAVSGRRDEALRLLADLSSPGSARYISPARIGQVHLGLGDRAAALAWLERAVDEQCTEAAWLAVHPMFDELRAESRFLALLERTGLPTTSSATLLAAPSR